MEFTGERFVPGADDLEELYLEHMSRYSFAARFARGRRVLDVGCGCGYGTHLLAASGAREAVGIDIASEAVEFAAGRYELPNLAYRVMDSRRLALEGVFDLVTCFELIEHVREDDAVVAAMASVLAADGICLVSTPNAATYVAGGEGGSNPYHFREYDVGEFEVLLRSGFSHVVMLEQRPVEGSLISPAGAAVSAGRGSPGAGEAGLLPGEYGAPAAVGAYGPASYFMAACSHSAPRAWRDLLATPYAALGGDFRYRKLKEEFDRRGRWARGLDDELRRKAATIARLREEMATIEREFDERGRWAKGLDREIREKDELIEKLAAENERLRRAAVSAGR